MKRRLLVAAGMSALLVATLAPGVTMARDPERFGQVPVGGRKIHVGRLPSQQARNKIVNIAVELEGRPVAAYQGAAAAAGQTLSEARKADIRANLDRRQDLMRPRLRGLGADIEASYTDVFNGFRIRVRGNRVERIAALPGVKAIYPVTRHTRSNANTISYIGADRTWAQTGFTGKGVTIAVIDTGINYYHADFGGAGFDAWKADDGLTRGNDFPTAKVVDGYDLVGDAYNANDAEPVIAPDPDPLDCKAADAETVQHGTHVAGTAAGYGVTSGGDQYTGAYTPSAVSGADLRIAPGVAPEARLMAFRVFGCAGSTWVTTDAIEMAVRAGADVINMSLGSTFGNPGSLDAVASNNAALAGTTVVASSGNEGPSAYVTGSPGSGMRVLTVAAMDAQKSFPGATIDMPTGGAIDAINANGADLPASGTLNVFEDDPDTPGDENTGEGLEQSGCTPESYAYNDLGEGQIAVVQRGFCARILKAQEGQRAGAAAVVMVNSVDGLPPFENQIAGVTIPFIGVPSSTNDRFVADEGGEARIRGAGRIGNPTYQVHADFSSAGPGRIENLIKPDVAAPGVSVFSADGSTVAQGKTLGGTSMAAPAVAGVAALVKEAHPRWQPRDIKAAIIGTASPGKVDPYDLRIVGSGLVQPRRAVDTVAFVRTTPGSSSVSFGYQEAGDQPGTSNAFTASRQITIVNTGSRAIRYRLSNTLNGSGRGLAASVSPGTVTVPAGGSRSVTVTVSLSEANAGRLPDAAPFHGPPLAEDLYGQLYTSVTTIGGAIRLDPTTSGAGIYPLRVPWQVVPRGLSRIQDLPGTRPDWASDGTTRSSSVKVRNFGPHRGFAELYAWGLQDADEGLDGIDLRGGGIASVDSRVCDESASADDRCVIVALNIWNRWSNAAENEYDVLIDLDRDGEADVLVAAIDLGLILGTLYGVPGSLIVDLASGDVLNLYVAGASPNGSTVLLPFLASDIGLSADGDRAFWYWAEAYDVYDADPTMFQFDVMTTGNAAEQGSQLAHFDVFDPVLNTGEFRTIASGKTKELPLTVDASRFVPAARGQKGWMIVSLEDRNGMFQADFVPVGPLS